MTLKFHHIWNTTAMASVNVITPWCDKIAKESNNRMKCQVFPAMSMGGTPPQLVDQVKDGVADLVITLPGYTPGRFPVMEVFELPFMTNSAEAGARAAWDFHNKYAPKEFAGTKLLAMWVHDEGYVHTRDKPVKVLADFKGLKMRAPTRQTNKLLGCARRLAGGHAAAGHPRRHQQGHDRRLPAALGSDAFAEAAGHGQVPQRDRPVAPGAVQLGLHLRHEPGQVRQRCRPT